MASFSRKVSGAADVSLNHREHREPPVKPCVPLWFKTLRYLFPMQRPAGVTAIAILFFLAALYLFTIAGVKLIFPEAISLTNAGQLMYGLELAGPYMALLVGSGWALVGWGLSRLHNWARWAAMLVMTLGIAWLVPKISMAELGVPLFWYGLQIALRGAAAWYLAQAPAVIDSFAKKS
jgi:hypothetical protein